MEKNILKLLKDDNFSLPWHQGILYKPLAELTREERKKYYQELAPALKRLRKELKIFFEKNTSKRGNYQNALIEDILAAGGKISILDSTIIRALGSLSFYQLLNQKAREQNIKITEQANNYTFILWLVFFLLVLVYIILARRG